MKVASIVGARPQFIKAAVVSRALREGGAEEVLIHTGQHYDANMSDVFFQELEIPSPDHHLGIGSASHGAQTGLMLQGIEAVLVRNRPDCVLVYGDTNSTLAGALAAVKLHLTVAHVEAGLRSFNRRMPEEINRVLTDHSSDLLFAPTDTAVSVLRREGIPDQRIYQVGDVMYDAALHYAKKADEKSQILQQLGLNKGRYLLATVHRAENTDEETRLRNLFAAFEHIAIKLPVIVPVHPRTRAALQAIGMLEKVFHGIRLIEPLGYLDMVMLERNARLIITDSGGVQKEAFFYRVPCVTVREETEWPELVEVGWNRLAAPTSAHRITSTVEEALRCDPAPAANLYGDGHSAGAIARILQATIGNNSSHFSHSAAQEFLPSNNLR
jgi:UDP-GlcNAc3NAcA epimerase